MDYICRCIPKYDFFYFDGHSQLQTKDLNIFQVVFRKVFGCYAETHLLEVVKRGYLATLNDRFHTTKQKQQDLLKLIAKANTVYKQSSSIKFPISEKESVTIAYRITSDFKISDIKFSLGPEGLDAYYIFIFKNTFGYLEVGLPYMSRGNAFETTLDVRRRLEDNRLQKLHQLLANSLKDTTTRVAVQCYSPSSGRRREDADFTNAAHDKGMGQLGWDYQNRYNMHRVYQFKRDSPLDPIVDFKQQLSLAFAISHLTTEESMANR